MTPSSRTRPRRLLPMWILELSYRFYAGAVARELNFAMESTDRALDGIEGRLIAIEEVIAARWPRSAVLRRRLARELRATDRAYASTGDTFRARRIEAVIDGGLLEFQRQRERRQGQS